MRVELENGYVLHSRPYGDTSVILNCFTEHYGKIALIAKGVRNRKVKQRLYVQPFTPLLISWQGKSGLKTLVNVEVKGALRHLNDKRLYSAFYLNELLMRLLPDNDDHPEVFADYIQALEQLYGSCELEAVLRQFEFSLIQGLGYGVDFHYCIDGSEISTTGRYGYVHEAGFVEAPSSQEGAYSGAELQAIVQGDYADASVRRAAKHLARTMLRPLLGSRPLSSRKLFKDMTVQGTFHD